MLLFKHSSICKIVVFVVLCTQYSISQFTCAISSTNLQITHDLAACINPLDANNLDDVYLSSLLEPSLEDCVAENSKNSCDKYIQEYIDLVPSKYIAFIGDNILSQPITACSCIHQYISSLHKCYAALDTFSLYCERFYDSPSDPEPKPDSEHHDKLEGDPEGVSDNPITVTDDNGGRGSYNEDGGYSYDDGDGDEDGGDESNYDDYDDSEENDAVNANPSKDSPNTATNNNNNQQQDISGSSEDQLINEDDTKKDDIIKNYDTCYELMLSTCPYTFVLSYSDAIRCIIINGEDIQPRCESLLNAVMASIAQVCHSDFTGSCSNKLDSPVDAIQCLIHNKDVSTICSKRIYDLSKGDNVPCSSEVAYCSQFEDIDEIIECLTIEDPNKLSHLCLPFVLGYEQCSDLNNDPATPEYDNDDKPNPKPKPKPKPKPSPNNGNSKTSDHSNSADRSTVMTRKARIQHYSLSKRDSKSFAPDSIIQTISSSNFRGQDRSLQSTYAKATPCWMNVHMHDYPSYQEKGNSGGRNEPSLTVIAIVCMASVFFASIAVSVGKHLLSTTQDGKGRYARAATSEDELGEEDTPAQSIAMKTFTTSARVIDSPDDYTSPKVSNVENSEYGNLPETYEIK